MTPAQKTKELQSTGPRNVAGFQSFVNSACTPVRVEEDRGNRSKMRCHCDWVLGYFSSSENDSAVTNGCLCASSTP